MEWNDVLVTWVNCLCGEFLNIEKINTIHELGGKTLFFKEVTNIIRKKQFDRTPRSKILQLFLESECPEIIEENFNFDPSSEDYTYLVSIFLALTALRVEKDDFKTPLFKMDQTTQKAVEKFLETIHSKEMKRDSLKTAIGNAVKAVKEDVLRTPVSQMRRKISVPNTSPLKDFFSSPVMRRISFSSANSNNNRELEEEIDGLLTDKSELQKCLKEKESVISSLRLKLDARNSEIEDIKELLIKEETARQSVAEKYKQLEHGCKERERFSDNLQLELNETVEKLISLESKFEESESNNRSLMSEMEELKSSNSKLVSNNAILMEDFNKLQEKYLNDIVNLKELENQREEIERLKKELRHIKNDHDTLKEKYRELQEKTKPVDKDSIRNEYEERLTLIKEKMKGFWHEDVKQKAEEFEAKLRQYKEKISKDETHIAELSSQLWETSDKLLRMKNEYLKMKKLYDELRLAYDASHNVPAQTQDSYARRRSLSVDAFPMKSRERDTESQKFLFDLQDESESGNPRRRSLLPSGMGRVFPSEDETGEIFDNRNLTELKEGRHDLGAEDDRMSILMMRNSLCPPHLKSSYPAETQFLIPDGLKENDIKCGGEAVSQMGVLKKKERTQESISSSRSQGSGVLRELQLPSSASSRRSSSGSTSSAAEPRTSITPSRLRALFTASGRRANRDENTPATVRESPSSQRKRLSFFNRHFGNRDSRSQF